MQSADAPVDKACSQVLDFLLELLGEEDLVRESRKGEVKVVC